jgi:putative oxidoreductase
MENPYRMTHERAMDHSISAVPQKSDPTRGAGRRHVATGLLALAAAGFLVAGGPKVLGEPTMVGSFAQLGVPRLGLAVLGALELAGAIGLLLRRTRVAAATGLASILFGAIAIHIASGMALTTLAMPVALLVLMGAGLALDPTIRFELVEVAHHSRARRATTVGLSVLLAAQFFLAGGMKAMGAADMITTLGRLHFAPAFVHVLGVLELAGAVGLLLGSQRARAALGLLAIMHGAVAVHVVDGFVPKGFAALAVLGLLWVVVALDGRLKVTTLAHAAA